MQAQYGNVPAENNSKMTLSDAGISRKLSSRAQQLLFAGHAKVYIVRILAYRG
jgi:hypothetical protein